MTQKRYAIVRVDYNCPKDVFHEYDFCLLSKGKTLVDICNHCDFLDEKRIIGDTKEQLIKKVKTALQLCNKNRVEKCNQFYFIAKEIVEFLGVEE